MTEAEKKSLEQRARDILRRAGVKDPDPQSMTSGDVVEIANLIQEVVHLKKRLARVWDALNEGFGRR